MTRIGIIRCQETAMTSSLPNSRSHCAGWNCMPAIWNKIGEFVQYDTIELVGFDTCGGCPGRSRTDKIVEKGLKLKEHGAEVIHLGTCISLFCSNKDMFMEVLEKEVGIPIKEKTHGGPEDRKPFEGLS
ncbi:CGGC domain-containing protein [Chloroflexota bacterium]